MPDLSEVLGYDRVREDLSASLYDADAVHVLRGPPGVGKSWLATEIGSQWKAAGGAVLIALGDVGRGDSAYYPFNYALGGISGRWRATAPLAAGAGKVAETLIGTGGTITSLVQALAALPGARRRRRTEFLGEGAQLALHRLERQSKRRPTLLIADNLHWWDRSSLDLVRTFLAEEMRESFPFLRKLRVLAVETTRPYQVVLNPAAHDELLATGQSRTFELPRVPREEFAHVLVALGAPSGLEPGLADEIYALSGGHLLLAKRAADHVLSRGETTLLDLSEPDEFQRVLLTERIHTLGGLGRETLELLQIASTIGLSFRQDEILCACTSDESTTRRLLRSCRDEEVLELDNETYRFVHDILRQFFGAAGTADPIVIHERLASCLRVLQPGNYQARCLNALKAHRPDDAGMFAVQAALQCDRQGTDWTAVLSVAAREAVSAAGLDTQLRILIAARDAIFRYDFLECQRLLRTLGHRLPESLLAEADYVRATCLMATRSEEDRAAGREVLRAWEGLEDRDSELGLRLMRLLLYGLALIRDKSEARALEHRLRVMLGSRTGFDSSAIDDLYVLDRCSGMIDPPDLALVRTREAERHFAPRAGEVAVAHPLEYYRCLVNLGANLLCNANYDEALVVHERLVDYTDQYLPGTFPRPDYPLSNQVLAQYRAGTCTADEAARRQRKIVTVHRSDADPFYADNALAVYLTLSGAFPEALRLFDALDDQLRATRRRPEPSMIYLIASNRVAARFLSGTTTDAAAEWRSLTALLGEIAYTTAPYLERRHELLAEVLAGPVPTPLAFDTSVVTGHPDEFGPLWDNYGRGFRMPEVEFWREA